MISDMRSRLAAALFFLLVVHCFVCSFGDTGIYAGFVGFCPGLECLERKMRQKMQILQKKSGKCFVVKKKAIPLHSLYNGNSAINDDRLFSSVGQST